MTATAGQDLRSVALEDLAGMLGTADNDLRAAIIAECDRRDRADVAARKRQAVRDEWFDAAHEQFLAAEAATNGYLLNKRGRALGLDPWTVLWTGSAARAVAYASEELLAFWETWPRVTVTDYRRQLASGRRVHADERERAAAELPTAAELVALARKVTPGERPALLDEFTSAGIDDLLDAEQAAIWLGISVKSVYVESSPSRNRWPVPDRVFGRSKAWTRRTLILHRAAMPGVGAPSRPRAKRRAIVA